MSESVNIAQAMQLLGVSRRGVYYLLEHGQLQRASKAGFLTRASVLELAERRRTAHNPPDCTKPNAEPA